MASLETFRSFGESLKAARIEQKRSLDDLASAIKINRRHLEAIEAGDLTKLPEGPYVAAFLREYARALGLVVPSEFAPVPSVSTASLRDPKVVSHPASSAEGRSAPLSQVARGTARFANTAVKSAVKSVSKTTENVVNLVETGGKEALEVLTSKSLWDEVENVRRERHGLPPIEPPVEVPPKRIVEDKPLLGYKRATEDESEEGPQPSPVIGQRIPKSIPIRSSKRITNIVIVVLALVFAGVAYLAIHMSKNDNGSIANKDYVPAPVEKPQPITVPNHGVAPAVTPPVSGVAEKPTVNDSLRFVLRATQPVWVSIAPDGIPAYRGELKSGEVRTFRARDKIVVNIGNQKSVVMTFDGAPISGLPAVQNSSVVVRDLVLMKDHVTLGGNSIDLHKLTGAPAAASTVPAAPKPSSVPAKANFPVGKRSASTPPKHISANVIHGKSAKTNTSMKGNKSVKGKTQAKNSKSAKGNQSTKGKKPLKKSSQPAPIIHPVEPIPPRP
jgi:transcriptional regulator with XRE-family HTH domain